MAGYTFRSEGLTCQGQIVGKVGDHLLVEGMALDSGAYFLQLGDELRRFDSRKEAEDYGAELAQDAAYQSPSQIGQLSPSEVAKIMGSARSGAHKKDLTDASNSLYDDREMSLLAFGWC